MDLTPVEAEFRRRNYPIIDVNCTRRVTSATPLQSLTMANSETMFELARGLAQRILGSAELRDDRSRMIYAFRLCFARPPTDAELRRLTDFLEAARERAPDNLEFVAWTATARVLMNLDEFITRE